MNKKQKKMLIRIIVASVLLIGLTLVTHLVEVNSVLKLLLYLVPYFIVGYDILKKAFKGILNKQVFDENFLMAVATVGAIIIALVDDGDFTEKTKEDILSAYNIIRHELVQLNSCEDNKINIKPAKYVAYSFERREE